MPKTIASKQKRFADPLWYKDAVLYEVRVRSFCDSNGDGIGDFPGLTTKLGYLQDLGVNTLWLLPFYPSPLRDDGYDISDYMDVHPEVGTLRDFKAFLKECHRRNMRVVTELVLNHTSDRHPWFQRARTSPTGSSFRDFYVWSDTTEKFKEARIIFKDFETSNWSWDPVAQAYYWHRFYSHQPDLNFDNPRVKKALVQVMDFWLDMGVDGLRLDAVPYLFEREGTNCENLSEGHALLAELRRHVDKKYGQRMLLAEANQWPEDAVAYFGDGDECHMAFHFPIMPRLFMAIQMEDRFPIVDILEQTPDIPETAQWALFLRNHDELTLEMVTDEERDYMYRVYASELGARLNLGIRRRLAPLLGNDRKKIELMNALLFSMPGTPVLYYGDEIGMGDNFYLGDRNGVRTPMQWSVDRNAGFSTANPQRLYLPVIIDPEYHYETVNVETQQNNPHSLLWWMKRLIDIRKRFRAFGRGSLTMLDPRNHKVLAFVRGLDDEQVLVVANLSRFAQCGELDLSFALGSVPVELFGRTEFPPIGKQPYLVTLGPHSFYWFLLEQQTSHEKPRSSEERSLSVAGGWKNLLKTEERPGLEAILPEFLLGQRWFAGKARTIKGVKIVDVLALSRDSALLTLARVEYADGLAETYVLPLAFAPRGTAERIKQNYPEAVVARLAGGSGEGAVEGILYDAVADPSFGSALLEAISHRRRFKGSKGTVFAAPTGALRRFFKPGDPTEASLLGTEQSNTSFLYSNRLILKLLRRLEGGTNPDLEVGRMLTEKASFPHAPPLAGFLEYRPSENGEAATLALLHGFTPNEGDAWHYTLDWLARFFERVLTESQNQPPPPAPHSSTKALSTEEIPEPVRNWLGGYLDSAALLGQRTAELHLALATSTQDPAFAPEPFSSLYQRSLYQSMRNLTGQVFRLLREKLGRLPASVRSDAQRVSGYEAKILRRFRSILDRKMSGRLIRCHGDYHLGQVLFTGKDFVIIDFEGEPARPISERRIKRSPLRDVAGMVRSFNYAAYAALPGYGVRSTVRIEDLPVLEPWARFWQSWTSSRFWNVYLASAAPGKLLPSSSADSELLLDILKLEKAIYELGYELNNRPEWMRIPLHAILEQMDETD